MSHCQRFKKLTCFDFSGCGAFVGVCFRPGAKLVHQLSRLSHYLWCWRENTGAGGGVTSATIVSVRKVGLTGRKLLQDCCCVDLLSQSGPCGPDFKPYLRGFRTGGLLLLQNVYIQKWTEKVLPVSSSLNKRNHSHFMPTISLKILNRFTCVEETSQENSINTSV